MHPIPLRLVMITAALCFGACQKKTEAPTAAAPAKSEPAKPVKPAVEMVADSERSRHFVAVNKQLELGGTLYGYVDIDGDLLQLTGQLQSLLAEVGRGQPAAGLVARQDLSAIVTLLGLTDVKALGVSSVPDGTGYFRNRLFVYTGGERHGLMAALGGKPGPLKHIGLAPADTTFFGESEMDFGVVYKTLKEVVAKVAGEPASNQIETMLQKAGEAATISYLDLIYGLKGRTAVVVRVDAEKTIRMPGRDGMVIPAFSLLACVEGIGQVVEPSLAKARELRRSDNRNLHIYEVAQKLPFEGVQPAFVVDGSMLYFTTSIAFLNECRAQKSGLAQVAEFKSALTQLGAENNGLTYVSPKLFARIRDVEKLNPNLPAQTKSVLNFVLTQMPDSDRPLVAARTNTEDGILIRSHLNRSMKQDIAAISIYNPITVGLMAAMAIPAFQKVQTASQDKAVLNNLRMLSAAADQHYLETGTNSATYDQLVGPTKYVKVLNPVAGENYRALRFKQGEPLKVRLGNGRMVEYAP
jgi:type IV pilus assembly protein PilA